MNERGLLDFLITRLPELSFREKLLLCELFEGEKDLIQKSRNDIEIIINRRLEAWWDIDIVRMMAERDAEKARLRGIKWVSWHSPEYPPLLREIYDPPVLLFFKGSLPNPELPLAAIVGTRKPSPQAAAQAFDIARDLAGSGISIVSGLALGIDAMAHRGNIEGVLRTPCGAPPYAVLGSGIDEIYPSANRGLARRILETGGALLSEYPPGTSPRKWNFPARNRIISGLSRGVLIVEAPQKSGALITAGFALEHNRELWVASAGAMDSKGQDRQTQFDRGGTAKLAEEGAGIAYTAGDILRAWNMEVPEPVSSADTDHLVQVAGRGSSPEQVLEGAGVALASPLASSLGITL